MKRRMIIKKELQGLLYDCKNLSEERAVELCIKKMLQIVKISRTNYIKTRFNEKIEKEKK